MPKYLVLFNASTPASVQMASATPEQMQASMNEWITWQQEASKQVSFEWGMPLQAAAQVTTSEVTSSDNHASGYCIIEGDNDVVSKLLQTHPHLKRQEASIDMLQMLPMPGL